VNAVLAGIVSKFFGFWNLVDGVLSDDGITPIGIPLQEPVEIWRPAVRGVVDSVCEQMLMKLFAEVRAAVWPATTGSWPLLVVWITAGFSVVDDWSSVAAASFVLTAVDVDASEDVVFEDLLLLWPRARRASSGTASAELPAMKETATKRAEKGPENFMLEDRGFH